MYFLTGLSVRQSQSDSIRNGIIMNAANETEDSSNTALADESTDKNAVQQQSVDDVIRPINGSIQRQQIETRKWTAKRLGSLQIYVFR